MKLKATIISIVSVLVIGLTAILLYCFWPAIKGTVDNSKYYTQEELQESYDKGYEDGCKTETELTGQVKYYKDLVDEYYIQVNTLNDEITMLTNTNRDYATHVSTLESQKTSLQEQVVNLTTIKSNNETTISQLNTQITQLQKEVADLENSGEDKDDTIAQKNTQIANLQASVSQLQKTNELNIETITNLNNQIASLNTQISDMTLQIQNNSTNVTTLNNKIAELEKSVSYYEQYIANLENGEQVVATFEFNGSVYNIQIVNKNDTVSVVTPTSTDYVIFNYWTVNGEQIDLSTYQITANTKIVANVTYKYDVKFMVADTEYNSQIVIKNGYATMPTNPTKTGYEFDGWTANGVDIVNPNTTAITQNTTYVAKFTKLHTVTFMYEDTTYTTQTVRNNEYSTNVTVDNTTYKVFNGWTFNGIIVDVTSQKIVADTTFIADITYKYDVVFMVNDTEYNRQIVVKNGYAAVPESPTKDGYLFSGWSIDNENVVDINSYVINTSVTFNALFTLPTLSIIEPVEFFDFSPNDSGIPSSAVFCDYCVMNNGSFFDTDPRLYSKYSLITLNSYSFTVYYDYLYSDGVAETKSFNFTLDNYDENTQFYEINGTDYFYFGCYEFYLTDSIIAGFESYIYFGSSGIEIIVMPSIESYDYGDGVFELNRVVLDDFCYAYEE